MTYYDQAPFMTEHYITAIEIDWKGRSVLVACRCGWLKHTFYEAAGLNELWLGHTKEGTP